MPAPASSEESRECNVAGAGGGGRAGAAAKLTQLTQSRAGKASAPGRGAARLAMLQADGPARRKCAGSGLPPQRGKFTNFWKVARVTHGKFLPHHLSPRGVCGRGECSGGRGV